MSVDNNAPTVFSIPTLGPPTNPANNYIGGIGSNLFYGYIAGLRLWSREKLQTDIQFDLNHRLYTASYFKCSFLFI